MIVGCTSKFDTETPEFQIPSELLTTNTYVGTWMITQLDLDKMISAGFRTNTNRTDHTLVLSSDGSCTFRTYTLWWPWDADREIRDRIYEENYGPYHYNRWCVYDRATSKESVPWRNMPRYYVKFFNLSTSGSSKDDEYYFITFDGTNVFLNRQVDNRRVSFEKIATPRPNP